MRYQQFIFENYSFDTSSKILSLNYSLDGQINFTETYEFSFEFANYNPKTLDKAMQMLFFIAGVSYYKTFAPPEIIVKKGEIDEKTAQFLGKTWQKGLGEFFYVNNLSPNMAINFPVSASNLVASFGSGAKDSLATHNELGSGAIVGLGGGKDSLVSIELLREKLPNLTTWSLGHENILKPLIDRVSLPHITVNRTWDRQLITLNNEGAMNGHVPISAIFACAGIVATILSGNRDVIVSNEQSANEPTLTYQGVEINHQYSKSQEFEQDFQSILRHNFGETVRYYSFLRPLSELKITELFAMHGFEKYKDVFSSCNRAFIHTSEGLSWCGKCPKCAFVFIALTPFINRADIETLFGGKNLLLDVSLEPLYRQLLGIEGDKPLECVGEVKESRAAMRVAFNQYPELAYKYEFELPDEYDFRTVYSDEMPKEIRDILNRSL